MPDDRQSRIGDAEETEATAVFQEADVGDDPEVDIDVAITDNAFFDLNLAIITQHSRCDVIGNGIFRTCVLFGLYLAFDEGRKRQHEFYGHPSTLKIEVEAISHLSDSLQYLPLVAVFPAIFLGPGEVEGRVALRCLFVQEGAAR